jgi:hypothetical protein
MFNSHFFNFPSMTMSLRGRLLKPHVKFTQEDDDRLCQLVDALGPVDWNAIADQMGGRNPRQCRERWINYLSPGLNTAAWTAAEDALLMQKYLDFGGKWVQIAKCFPNRTDCMVKNRFNKLQRRGRKQQAIVGSIRCPPPLFQVLIQGPPAVVPDLPLPPVMAPQPPAPPVGAPKADTDSEAGLEVGFQGFDPQDLGLDIWGHMFLDGTGFW